MAAADCRPAPAPRSVWGLHSRAATGSSATLDGGDREIFRADVSRALHQLPEMQRAVLVAKVYDDLTFAQISEELSISLSTAKTHYVRAVTALRDALRDRWLEEVQP